MSTKKVAFKESRIIGTTLLLFGGGFLASFVPNGSIPLLLFNWLLALIASVLFYFFWKSTKHQSKRYFSLLSYVMLNVLAIYFVIPMLRIYFLTITFWIGIIMLLVMIIVPYLFSRDIAFGIQKPYKSKLGKIFLIYTVFVLGFGISAYMQSLYTSNPEALTIAVFAFFFALLLLFVAPTLLIKPQEMDHLIRNKQ